MSAVEFEVQLGKLGERYGELRLTNPQAEQQLQQSLERYGQMSPLVVMRTPDDELEVIDGFKRLHAARQIEGLKTLRARVLTIGERAAKAAVLCLNWVSKTTSDLEEAWVVRSLIREDGLTQVEVGELLSRDKSWVSRRLSLVERLNEEAQSQLRLGLLKPSVGRELARLPRGNQKRALEVAQKYQLGSREAAAFVKLLLESNRAAQEKVLSDPLASLSSGRSSSPKRRDEVLSKDGNCVLRDLQWMQTVCRQLLVTLRMKEIAGLMPEELFRLSRPAMKTYQTAQKSIRALDRFINTIEEVGHVPGRVGVSGRDVEKRRTVCPEDRLQSGDQSQHGQEDTA